VTSIRFFNIQWDTTDAEHPVGQVVDLPTDVVLDVDDDLDPEYEGADVLSDKFGWCVTSFDYERVSSIER
jgi:hypothetical protein